MPISVWPTISVGFSVSATARGESLTDFGGIVAVDTDDAPAPSLVLGHDILGRNLLDLGRKLDIVRVVEHDQVAQPEMPGDAADALRNLFLNTAVGDERVGLVRHPVAEASYEKTLGDRRTQSHRMALPQRARGILNPAVEIDLGDDPGVGLPHCRNAANSSILK